MKKNVKTTIIFSSLLLTLFFSSTANINAGGEDYPRVGSVDECEKTDCEDSDCDYVEDKGD